MIILDLTSIALFGSCIECGHTKNQMLTNILNRLVTNPVLRFILAEIVWISLSDHHLYIGSCCLHRNILREFHEISKKNNHVRPSTYNSDMQCMCSRVWWRMSSWWNSKAWEKNPYCPFCDFLSHNYDRFVFNFSRWLPDCVCECNKASITWRRENTENEPKNRKKNKHIGGRKRMEIFEIVSDT